MDKVIQALLEYGVLGVVVLLLIAWIYYKDKRWDQERKEAAVALDEATDRLLAEQLARVEDAKAFTQTALALQEKAIAACGALNDDVKAQNALNETIRGLVDMLQKNVLFRTPAPRDDRGRYGS